MTDLDLEKWQRTHAAMVTRGDYASAARLAGRCRAACLRAGVATPPAWALLVAQPLTSAAKRVKHAELLPAAPMALPAPLIAWRAAGAGRIVSRAFDGKITLHDWPDGKPVYARFRSEAAALEALETGAIEWTRKNRKAA